MSVDRSASSTASRNGQRRADWRTVADIPKFPFDSFAALRGAIADRSFSLGVDSLAAARWADAHASALRRSVVAGLSVLLVAAAVAAVVAAFALGNYWLLLAPVVQVVAFYFSHPGSPASRWVTVLGAASLVVFLNLAFNRLPTAALLVAYAGLTFAVVRAASFMNNSAFRKALSSDEAAFLAAYGEHSCTLRENKTGRVYAHAAGGPGPRA
jgi:hypothetical protein